MRRFILLFSILACMQVNAGIKPTALDRLINAHAVFCKLDKPKPSCCPVCPIGPAGETGNKGRNGRKGPRGPTGSSLEINDFLEASTTAELDFIGGEFISFTAPISYSVNGIQASIHGGMALVESVPLSGNFDTITLPIEKEPTLYMVTHAVSLEDFTSGDFQVVLNGTPLPYTDLGIRQTTGNALLSRTSVILNPANTPGTINILVISGTILEAAIDGGITAYVTVLKLNNLGS